MSTDDLSQEGSTQDNRQAPRAKGVVVEYTFDQNEPFNSKVFIRDISQTGLSCMIYGGPRLDNANIWLKIYCSGHERPLRATGRVVWCRPSDYLKVSQNKPYDIGIELTQMNERDKEILTSYLLQAG